MLKESKVNKILKLRRDGYSYEKIAKKLGISPQTAHRHGRNVEKNQKSAVQSWINMRCTMSKAEIEAYKNEARRRLVKWANSPHGKRWSKKSYFV